MQFSLFLVKTYFSFLFISLITLILGAILRKVFSYSIKLSFRNLFFSFLTGLNALIFIFSVYYTSFRTIFILLPLVIIPFIGKKASPIKLKTIAKTTIIFCLIAIHIISFLFSFFNLFDFSPEIYNVYVDNHFYIRLAEFLKITGEENMYHGLNLLSQSYHNPKPYHYSDIWSILIANTLSPLSLLKSLFLIVTPLYIFLTLLGFISYFQSQLQKHSFFKIAIIVFIGLNCGGIYLSFFDNFSFISTFEEVNNLLLIGKTPTKHLMVYPLIMAFILLQSQAQKFALMALMAISSFAFLPAALGAMILEFIFLFITKRKLEYVKGLFLPIFICFSIIIFYHYFKNEGLTLVGFEPSIILEKLVNDFTNTSSLVGIMKNIVATILRHGIFFGLFFVYCFVFNRETLYAFVKQTNERLVFFILLAGAFTLAFFRDTLDSLQLVYNISMPFFAITMAILILKSILKSLHNRRFFPVFLGLLLFVPISLKQISNFGSRPKISQVMDSSFITEVSQWCNEQQENILLGGSMKNSQTDFPGKYGKTVIFITLGYPLVDFIKKPFLTISLNDLSIPLAKDSLGAKRDIAYISQGILYNYAQENSKFLLSEGEIIAKFIKEKKLTFIITHKTVRLPKEVLILIEREIIDEKSGQRFLILKK